MTPFLIDGITNLFGGLFTLIDKLHTSDDERLQHKQTLMAIQAGMISQWMTMEQQQLQTRADIIIAEAKGESWLQRSWRPVIMLVFAALVVSRWLGLTQALGLPVPEISAELEMELFTIIKLGIGGYVIGRSVEKVALNLTGSGLVDTITEKVKKTK